MVTNGRFKSVTLIILMLTCFASSDIAFSKDKWVELHPFTGQLSPEITFLEREPVIDGKLDMDIKTLPVRDFNMFHMSNDSQPTTIARYRIAYGMEFLYIFIEVEADKYICRDRGYQNGDGFVLVLAKTNRSEQDSDENYRLAFNPTGDKKNPYKKMIWDYNNKISFTPFNDDTKFAVVVNNGRTGFELALQWKDIYPYHPLLMDKMYFNLIFTKAVGETDINQCVVANDTSTNDFWKATTQMIYQKPEVKDCIKSYLVFDKNHIEANEEINIKAVSLSSEPRNENVIVIIYTGEDTAIDLVQYEMKLEKGLTVNNFKFNSKKLSTEGYKVRWETEAGGSKGEFFLTVLPPFDEKWMENVIKSLEGRISAGSLNTIKFSINDIQRDKNNIRSYDTAGPIRVRIHKIMETIDKAHSGEDAIAMKTGFVRRAFLSHLDNTLQPYVVRIPKNYDPSKLYPAIVYLHGSDSDSDDRDIIGIPQMFFPDDFIIISPNARGPLTWYVLNHAQEDIQEAIADAIENYSIDPNKLIISGFSMGGYGTYRTLYETPDKYVGAAVFSGLPYSRTSENPDKFPDFSNTTYINKIKDKYILIIHGKKDRNCPYEKIENMVKKFKSAGTKVLFLSDPEAGHSFSGDPAIIKAYLEWLRKVVGSK